MTGDESELDPEPKPSFVSSVKFFNSNNRFDQNVLKNKEKCKKDLPYDSADAVLPLEMSSFPVEIVSFSKDSVSINGEGKSQGAAIVGYEGIFSRK